MGEIMTGIRALAITFVASILMIILGIVYFAITLWVVQTASNLVFGPGLDANWAVFSAAIISTGAVLAGALEKKPTKGRR